MTNDLDRRIADHEQAGMVEAINSTDLAIPAGLKLLEFETSHSDYDQWSFAPDADPRVTIMVASSLPVNRESLTAKRFAVVRHPLDGDLFFENEDSLYDGDDWAEACRIAREATPS